MLTYWSVPVCGLAVLAFLRLTRVAWSAGLGLALLVLPFAVPAAAGCALAAAIVLRMDSVSYETLRQQVLRRSIVIGSDASPRAVAIPLGDVSGSHTLIVGATGSGKTVTETLIVRRAIEAGHGAVIVDPKGDALLREHARAAAAAAGRAFLEWTPTGPTTYNPYGHGSAGACGS